LAISLRPQRSSDQGLVRRASPVAADGFERRHGVVIDLV
jgi:hypothetical protein